MYYLNYAALPCQCNDFSKSFDGGFGDNVISFLTFVGVGSLEYTLSKGKNVVDLSPLSINDILFHLFLLMFFRLCPILVVANRET